MKKLFIILNILFLSLTYAQETDKLLKVTYVRRALFMPEGDFDTFLYVDGTRSQFVFQQKETTIKDDQGFGLKLNFLKYINDYDSKNQIVEENRELKDGTILYATWKNDIVWEITEEESQMEGYKVRKAMTDSFDLSKEDPNYNGKATAWFTTDIPVQAGPGRYFGLPGLIVDLSFDTTRKGYTLKKVEYIPKDKYHFVPLDKENLVEKEDVVYYFHKNPKMIKEIQKAAKKKRK